jgi:glucose/arabinose dehydrogenase
LKRTTAVARLVLVVALAAGTTGPAAAQELAFQPVVEPASFPTNLAFATDGRAFYTEKDTGRIRVVSRTGAVVASPFATLPVASSVDEMGLLGLALPPDFAQDPWVYAYYSDAGDGRNHLVRIPADGNVGGTPENLLTLLPTENGWHNGGDLAFGADGKLYVAVGEGHVPGRAQDRASLGGKILRLEDDGTAPADNPFGPDSPVYAIGIRNSFGLCAGPAGELWATDNGPAEWDELNRIEPAANYGWPLRLGPGEADGFTPPVFAWREEIVPTGCVAAADGTVYVGGYRGDLHRISFPAGGRPVDTVVASFDAGITDVERSPTGRLYVATDDAIFVRTGLASGRGPFTPAGIVILLVLVGLLALARRRLERR